MQVFRENGLAMRRMQEENAVLSRQTAEQRQQDMTRLAQNFETHVGAIMTEVADAAEQLRGTAQTMTGIAGDATLHAAAVATASEEASRGVQNVAAAAEELTASIGEISRQVQQSSQVVARAVTDAHCTDGVIRQLADAAGKIGEVVRRPDQSAALYPQNTSIFQMISMEQTPYYPRNTHDPADLAWDGPGREEKPAPLCRRLGGIAIPPNTRRSNAGESRLADDVEDSGTSVNRSWI